MKRGPFNVLRDPNAWESVPRDPATIAFAAANAAGLTSATTVAAFTATTFGMIATGVVGIGLSIATNAILTALTPAPPTPKQSLLVNSRDAAAPQEFVYGEVRKGGPITYLETTRGGSVLYQIIPLAAHEIESVEAIYINDEVATISNDAYSNSRRSGAGWVTNRNWSDDPDEHEIRIFYHLGDQTAITDTFANSSTESLNSAFFDTGSSDEDSQNFGGVGQPTKASFVGNGIAYLFVRFSYASGVFQNGIPVITAKIRGKKVFDPRTSTTAYSNNAALCIRDYLTSAYGLNDAQVDDTVFQAAANACDENVNLGTDGNWALSTAYAVGDTVTNDAASYICILDHTSSASDEPGVGGSAGTYWEAYTEKRYTLNGVVRANQNYGDVLQQMITSCAGTLFWGGGKWKLAVGEYNAPTKTFTLDDLRSNISLQTRVNLRDQFNKVQGVFNDAENRYIAADYPPIESATFLTEDDGVEQALDLDLPFTTSGATAQRLAKMTLLRGREQMVFQAEFGLNAFDVEVGEIVALTIDRYGWTAKEFEVVSWRFFIGGEGDLRVALSLRETSEDAFAWDAEETAIIFNNSDLINPSLPSNPLINLIKNGDFAQGSSNYWTTLAGASGWDSEMVQTSGSQGGLLTAETGVYDPDSATAAIQTCPRAGFIKFDATEIGTSGESNWDISQAGPYDADGAFQDKTGVTSLEFYPLMQYDGFIAVRPGEKFTFSTFGFSRFTTLAAALTHFALDFFDKDFNDITANIPSAEWGDYARAVSPDASVANEWILHQATFEIPPSGTGFEPVYVRPYFMIWTDFRFDGEVYYTGIEFKKATATGDIGIGEVVETYATEITSAFTFAANFTEEEILSVDVEVPALPGISQSSTEAFYLEAITSGNVKFSSPSTGTLRVYVDDGTTKTQINSVELDGFTAGASTSIGFFDVNAGSYTVSLEGQTADITKLTLRESNLMVKVVKR